MDSFVEHACNVSVAPVVTPTPQRLVARYFAPLVCLTRRRLSGAHLGGADEEDVVLSVLKSCCLAIASGRLAPATDEQLWRMLVTMTRRKLVDYLRHDRRVKRGGRQVPDALPFAETTDGGRGGLHAIPDPRSAAGSRGSSPQTVEELVELLPDEVLRRIAVRKVEGFCNAEIAAELGMSLRAVERKLRLIRTVWRAEGVEDVRR